jgi:DNA-binding beta-propeller fold protein YncE
MGHRRKWLTLTFLTISMTIVCSCHGLTEFEGSLTADILFIRTSDHTFETSLDGIPDGRAICSINNSTFYVLSGSGMLYKMNSEEMVVDTVITVFTGPGSGIYDIVAPPPRQKLYVLGNGSQLVEVNISSNTVTDVFQIGPSPCSMVSSREPYNTMLYVGDAQDNRFREVDINDNRVVRQIELSFPPQSMELSSNGDFVMVCSRADGVYGLVNLQVTPLRFTAKYPLDNPVYDIQVVADSSDFFMSCPRWNAGDGFVLIADSLGTVWNRPDPLIVPGHPFSLASTPDGHYLYVLSNTGNGTGLLTVVNVWFGGVEAQIPIDGYPWDVTVHRNGELVLVLVGE